MIARLTFALALLATAASAREIEVLQPPASFLPYTGPKEVFIYPQPIVATICRLMGANKANNGELVACSIKLTMGCIEWLPALNKEITPHSLTGIEAHEDAHCNGWHHPDE